MSRCLIITPLCVLSSTSSKSQSSPTLSILFQRQGLSAIQPSVQCPTRSLFRLVPRVPRPKTQYFSMRFAAVIPKPQCAICRLLPCSKLCLRDRSRIRVTSLTVTFGRCWLLDHLTWFHRHPLTLVELQSSNRSMISRIRYSTVNHRSASTASSNGHISIPLLSFEEG